MAFKVNYNQQRNERNRAKQAKKDAKLREREDELARRKAAQLRGEDPSSPEDMANPEDMASPEDTSNPEDTSSPAAEKAAEEKPNGTT